MIVPLFRRVLRLPEALEPPPGSEPTLRVFQPSRKLYQLELVQWSLKQLGALVGIVISILLFRGVTLSILGFELSGSAIGDHSFGLGALRLTLGQLLSLLETTAIVTYVVQLPVTWAVLQLGWAMRWYMVSDESLRLRDGVFRIREQTMTVANIQNMEIRRGPIQGLIGIADLEVHTAGGGAKASEREEDGTPKGIHVARFRGLDDAVGLRNQLRRALDRHRGPGLGEEDVGPSRKPAPATSLGTLADAAEALRDEAAQLRRQLA